MGVKVMGVGMMVEGEDVRMRVCVRVCRGACEGEKVDERMRILNKAENTMHTNILHKHAPHTSS